MKKRIALLLALLLLLSAGCAEKAPAPEPEVPEESASEGGMLENEFWSLSYSGDWIIDDAASMQAEGVFATALLAIPDGDRDVACVYVEAAVKDASDYRAMISDAGADAYTVIAMQSANTTNIGGIDFFREDGTYDDQPMIHYFARVENAGITAQIRVTGEVDDPRVQQLLSSVKFTPRDIGNVDPPWPWEGEVIAIPDHAAQLGQTPVMTHQLRAEESILSTNAYDGHLAACGDRLYVLYQDSLRIYDLLGDYSLLQTVALDDAYRYITACENGMVYLADYEHPLLCLRDGVQEGSFACENYAVMHPSGEWGLSFLTYNDVERITLSGDSLTSEAWTLSEVQTISAVSISRDHILVSGKSAASGQMAVFVYDLEGKLEMTLGDRDEADPDYLAEVSAAVETGSGFLALDAKQHKLFAWTADGAFSGATDDEYLFGTENPWMNSMTTDGAGNVFIGMAEQRPDQSASEYIIYQMTGY